MNSTVKTVVFWLVIVLSGVLLWQVVKVGNSDRKNAKLIFRSLCHRLTRTMSPK